MPSAKGSGDDPGDDRPQSPILEVKAVEIVANEPSSPPLGDAAADAKDENESKDPPTDPEPEVARPEAPPPRKRSLWPAAVAGVVAVVAGGFLGAFLLNHIRGDEERALELQRRLQAVEASQQTFASRRAAEEAATKIAAIETRLTAAESAAGRPGTDPELAGRVAALDQSGRDANAAIAALRKRIDEMAAAAAAAREPSATPSEVAALEQRVAAVEQAAKSLEASLAAQARASDMPARFALAVMALRSRAESGQPYARELQTVKALDAGNAALAPLEPFADAGIPSAATLAQEFSALLAPARPVPAAAPAADKSASLWDRFLAGLGRLVQIRPAGQTPPPSVSGDSARVRAFVTGGDLPQALAEAGKLPEAARQKLEPWIARVRQRIAALDALRDLVGAASTRLSARPQ